MKSVTGWALRPRGFIGVRGPGAADFLQRMLSNDVVALDAGEACDALLLTPKARLIAPLRVLRRADDDFLLLTEPELADVLRAHLVRARFAAKAEVEPEEHRSSVVFGTNREGIATEEYGVPAAELLDVDPAGPELGDDEVEALRIRAGTPRWGRELDDRVLPAEAGLVDRAISLTKGCYPGQEPIARLHYRGHVNRRLRRLTIEGGEPPAYDAELQSGDRIVGRVTSAVRTEEGVLALGYVRTDVPEDAALTVAGRPTRLI